MTEAYVTQTQKDLGPLISTPKLTDKLLSRPPFRFLHDIVTSFLKATGFPEGLYPSAMLDAANVNDRESKINFLRLLITAVESATGETSGANPAKIIAGQEAEHTNRLLQQLAKCATLSPRAKARAIRAATAPNSSTAKPAGAEPSSSAAAAAATSSRPVDTEKTTEERAKPSNEDAEAQHARRRAEKEERRRREKEKDREAREKEKQKEKSSSSSSENHRKDNPTNKDDDDDDARQRRHRREKDADPSRHRSSKRRHESDEVANTAAAPERPASASHASPGSSHIIAATARKAPPRTKPTDEVTHTVTAHAAAVIRDADSAAAGAAGQTSAEEETANHDWQRIAEQVEAGGDGSWSNAGRLGGAHDDAAAEAKGLLAQQALRAKKAQEEEARRALAEEEALLAEEQQRGGIVIRSGKTAAARAQTMGGWMVGEGELSKLREQLQMLTKASNPLGKFLQVIHDDIDSMTRELEMWRSEARSQAAAAAEARRQTQESLEEIQAQLQNMDAAMSDQLVKNNYLRRNVLMNDSSIEGMIRMIVSPEVTR